MRIAIMQPYIFPYLSYFQLINAVDRFILYDDVNYINKGWINRNYILINEKANLFTIPLVQASQNKKINEINILGDKKWKYKFLKTIELAYKKAPFFYEIFTLIENVIYNNEENLSLFNYYAIKHVCSFLEIKTELIPSSDTYKNSELKGEERIIDICRKEKAAVYINPQGGTNIYHRENFRKANINLHFLNTKQVTYQKFGNPFDGKLSIIDTLMFCDKNQMKDILLQYYLT